MSGTRRIATQDYVPAPRKPKALVPGSVIATFAPSSPAKEDKIQAGLSELQRIGFSVQLPARHSSEGYFASDLVTRCAELVRNLTDERSDGLVALRGGYGSNYLLTGLGARVGDNLKAVVGFSDVTSLQIYLWQQFSWVTFHGPMVAAGFEAGAGMPGGYDEKSFRNAVGKTDGGWTIPLLAESLVSGDAEGILLGGCMTLLEATIGTPWELNTRDAILVLEDRAMKPYQVDRVLMHLKQAGKLTGLKGMIVGEFPECEPTVAGSPSVRDVCRRILGSQKVPIVCGAPVGHTLRPMLTLPLGVRARLIALGEGTLEILEPAVVA
jgi:muramoyltetrapeptide carboxypeptidase